jgi:hypothetical protein
MTIMTSNSITISRRLPRINFGTAWLLGWLMLAAWFGFGREWLRDTPTPAQAAVAPRPSALAPQPKLEVVAISKMRVGDQVPADNPTGEKDNEFGDTVDPPSWRKLVLLAPKKDGSFADVELLRPLWWLEEQQAEVGGEVDINVPECGIEGHAKVLTIEPCPPTKLRSGLRVVTGVFKHRASKVLDVYVEGLDEPIGTTPNHPFWSEDRQSFVRADELKEGEHLRAFNGTPIVRRVVPLEDPEPVFNLEVQCDHVYHVAKNGVLVHNSGPCPQLIDPSTIRFTQNSISNLFRNGNSVTETIARLRSGAIAAESFPRIRVFEQNGLLWTLDNRRLYVFQQAGLPIRTVPATAEEIASELPRKFTTINDGLSIIVRGIPQ